MMHLQRKYDAARMTSNEAMYAIKCGEAIHHLGEADIISEAGIICHRQTSLKKALAIASAFFWWALRDSNPGPSGYEPDALTN